LLSISFDAEISLALMELFLGERSRFGLKPPLVWRGPLVVGTRQDDWMLDIRF